MKIRSALCFGLIGLTLGAHAQTYPSKPITFIVPWPAGGNSDFTARVMAPELGKQLGQTVVIDNQAGGAGVLGMQKATQAAPDGHTIYFGGTELVVPPMVNPKLSYDWKKRFTPVGQFAAIWFVIAAPSATPFASFAAMVEHAKKNPGKLSYASPGIASTQHMVGESLREHTGAAMVHIPYRGGAQIVTDLMGGTVDAGFLTVAGMLANQVGGKLKPMAVTAPTRVPQFPDVPSITEIEGMSNFSMGTWQGLFVPVGTPAPVVARLADALQATMKAPAVRAELEKAGAVITLADGNTFTKYIDAEAVKYKRVIEFAKMQVNE